MRGSVLLWSNVMLFILLAVIVACSGQDDVLTQPSATPVLIVPKVTPFPTPTPVPTPTPAPAPEIPERFFTVVVSPPEPVMGDMILLTAFFTGSGGIPQYTIRVIEEVSVSPDDSRVVRFESLDEIGNPTARRLSQLGVPVNWELEAIAPGEVTFQVSVNYEAKICLLSDCYYQFTNSTSDHVTVMVGD